MKKIIILIVGILFSATTIFAFSASGSGSASVDGDDLMSDFDGLVKEVRGDEKEIKNNCICTREYAPVCGEVGVENETAKSVVKKTFSNKCTANCAKAKNIHDGKCDDTKVELVVCPLNMINPVPCEKKGGKLVSKGEDKNGCSLGYECVGAKDNGEGSYGVNDIVAMPIRASVWAKVDDDFSFNLKTKEWKDDSGICHTCTEENGFTKDGNIVIDGKVKASIDTELEPKEKGSRGWEKEQSFNFNFEGDKIKVNGGNGLDLKNGVKINNNLIKIDINSDGKDEIKIFGNKNDISVKVEGENNIFVRDGFINIGDAKIKIDVDTSIEKAKKVASANLVLDAKIVKDGNKVNYVIKTQKKTKFLGLFNFDMESDVKLDVETGAVVEINEPWYSFLLF